MDRPSNESKSTKPTKKAKWFDGLGPVGMDIQPPVTQPPAIQPPAIQPPAIQPPAIQPPAIQPPVTQPPAIQPPVTQPPAIQLPAIQLPAIQQPATQGPPKGPDMTFKYPIPLPEPKKPLPKAMTEDEMDEAMADYEFPPEETPLQKALREDEEQNAKKKQGNNIPMKSTSTKTMFSNPQKETPSYRIQQIARVGVKKDLVSSDLASLRLIHQ